MLVQVYEVSAPEEARAVAVRGVDHVGVLVGDGRFPRELPVEVARDVIAAVVAPATPSLLLLDSHEPGDRQVGALGRTHDWAISRRIVASVRVPVILAGGLGPDNVAAAIATVRPAGVDSKTRTDRSDGSHRKDVDRVQEFARIAKSASF